MTIKSHVVVDEDLRAALDVVPHFGRLDTDGIVAMRTVLAPIDTPTSDLGVTRQLVTLRGEAGYPDVEAQLFRPDDLSSDCPVLINLHGGGYIAGSALAEDATLRRLAVVLRCAVFSIEYRLAPEHPYPAAADDCLTAITFLRKNAAELSIDTDRLAIRGVSAGGGLAAGLALRIASDEHAPKLLMLIYPMLDDRTLGDEGARYYVWTTEANRSCWEALLRGKSGDSLSLAAPARARDLSGLPPLFVAVGSIDLFASECVDFACRAMASGVPTELHVYPGAYHGFNLVRDARVTKAFDLQCEQALWRAFYA